MVVDEAFQGKGIGKRLLQRTMTALGNRNISLYASKRGVPFYEKMGFKPSKMFRYQTTFPVNRSYLKGINFLGSILIKYVSLNWPQAASLKGYEFPSGSERKIQCMWLVHSYGKSTDNQPTKHWSL